MQRLRTVLVEYVQEFGFQQKLQLDDDWMRQCRYWTNNIKTAFAILGSLWPLAAGPLCTSGFMYGGSKSKHGIVNLNLSFRCLDCVCFHAR